MQRQFAGVDGPRYLGLGGALLRANWEPDAAEFGTDARSLSTECLCLAHAALFVALMLFHPALSLINAPSPASELGGQGGTAPPSLSDEYLANGIETGMFI